jgi:hypothetical protein
LHIWLSESRPGWTKTGLQIFPLRDKTGRIPIKAPDKGDMQSGLAAKTKLFFAFAAIFFIVDEKANFIYIIACKRQNQTENFEKGENTMGTVIVVVILAAVALIIYGAVARHKKPNIPSIR